MVLYFLSHICSLSFCFAMMVCIQHIYFAEKKHLLSIQAMVQNQSTSLQHPSGYNKHGVVNKNISQRVSKCPEEPLLIFGYFVKENRSVNNFSPKGLANKSRG